MAAHRALTLASPLAAVTLASLALGACSGSSALTTGSLLGTSSGSTTTAAAAAPAAPPSDPISRALQVGATSGRATRCGYHFEPGRLKGTFLAAEAQRGATSDSMAKVEKAFDTAHTQILATTSNDGGYCSDERTRTIKADLARHLGGDFEPARDPQTAKAASSQGGLFSTFWDSDGDGSEKKPFGKDAFDPIDGAVRR